MKQRFRRLAVLAGATIVAAGAPALADKIKHPTAVFSGLDKITGRIISFEAALGETVQFGSLQITPRVCYSRPPTEAPQTDAFAEVDEVLEDHSAHPIFSGWMFADSPGMHGVEHPVYDIWLTGCKGDGELIHEAPTVADAEKAQGHSRRTGPARPQWAGRASDHPAAGPAPGARAGPDSAQRSEPAFLPHRRRSADPARQHRPLTSVRRVRKAWRRATKVERRAVIFG